MQELETIAAKMKECASNDDYEVAHAEAAALLVRLVRVLCGGDTHMIVESILTDYYAVGKWYA